MEKIMLFLSNLSAKDKSTEEIPREITLNMKDFIVSNKQYSNSLDFTVPPSTQALSVFVQNSAAGSIKKLGYQLDSKHVRRAKQEI